MCNVLALTIMMIHCVAGLGDVQVGPEKFLPEIPNIFSNITTEVREASILGIIGVIVMGIALGICCCLSRCNTRKCGVIM